MTGGSLSHIMLPKRGRVTKRRVRYLLFSPAVLRDQIETNQFTKNTSKFQKTS